MQRALLVEDEVDIREVVGRLLEGLRFEVRAAGSAEEGLALAERESFDLILMDLELPGLSGLAAVPRFAQRWATPILLMSGHADSELEADAKAAGARGLLGKPFDLERLREAVSAAFKA